ncbi:type II toxin-antitoxin system VapC family toxin [Dietzia sp. 179-F 9C3 NHS]|uniref:type II toxin-antitoxin system VapC family toxin n=1 Tax=Dietzia sp. 179-F 9C3 NHS TaxID=3374295 RepID=UPI003879F990
MIVDTSVFVAILRREPERDDFLERLASSPSASVSAGSLVELTAVIENRRPDLSAAADLLLDGLGIVAEPFTVQQSRIARQAYRTYGRGSGHPAKLNLGDCFSYALAKELDLPLLYKGDDFSHTDVTPAL